MVLKLPSSNKPLAFSYVRMSTLTQKKGDSWRRQMAKCKRYAEDHDLHLVDLKYEDIGVSAYTGENIETGALSRFLESARAGEIPKGSYLIVESLDRISREAVYTALSRFLEIINTGIKLVTLEDGVVYSSDNLDISHLLGSIIIMQRSNNESAIKGMRGAAAWEQKRKNIGDRKLTSKCPAWLSLSNDKRSFSVIDARAAVVKDIFAWSNGGLGDYGIARRLNKLGVEPFGRAKDWGKSYVSKILQNRAVLGEYEPHRLISKKRVPTGDVRSNYFPRLIDDDTFNRVQVARMKRNVGGKGRKGEFISNLFTNLANCYYCNAPMHYINKGSSPRGGKYLKCSSAIKGSNCCSSSWRYSEFEQSFLFFLREIDLHEIAKQKHQKDEEGGVLQRISELQKDLASKELERDRIFAALLVGKSPDEWSPFSRQKFEAVEQSIEEIGKKIKELNKSKKASPAEKFGAEEYVEVVRAFQKQPPEAGMEYRLEARNAILDFVEGVRIAVVGNKPPWGAFDDRDKETVPLIPAPFFVVDFIGNSKRIVSVEPQDPFEIRFVGTLNTYEGQNISVGGEKWSGTLDADFVFELSEEELQSRLKQIGR